VYVTLAATSQTPMIVQVRFMTFHRAA